MKKCEIQFRDHLSEHALKLTRERKEILDTVHAYSGHFDVESLIFKMRQQGSRVSRGTVYRTIPLLVEAKVLRPVAFTDRHAHYEDTCKTKHHEHLICLGCGKVIEFYRKDVERELEKICREYNFQTVAHKMEVTGYCSDCIPQKKKQAK